MNHENLLEILSTLEFLLQKKEQFTKEENYKQLNLIEKLIETIEEIKQIQINIKNNISLREIAADDKELQLLAEEEQNQNESLLEIKINEIYNQVCTEESIACNEVLLEIRAGVGGDEASLFASELLKIYIKHCEDYNIKFEIVELSENEIKGIKSCSLILKKKNIYEKFQLESGVHRVQRVPETESNGRLHTSAVSVAVLPFYENIKIQINPNDLKIDTYRAGGAGGQHVNKTDSAVRLTHIPSGIVVQCQDERSQIKNKEKAMRILKNKLQILQNKESQQNINKLREQHVGGNDRSDKIRTYNFPQNRLTDHRYNLTLYQLDIIMAGNYHLLLEKIKEAQQEESKKHNIKEKILEKFNT